MLEKSIAVSVDRPVIECAAVRQASGEMVYVPVADIRISEYIVTEKRRPKGFAEVSHSSN